MKSYLKTYLKNRPLFLSIIRTPEVKLFYSKLPFKKPILDFGCGDGFFTKVTSNNHQVIDIGVDVDEKALKIAGKENIYKYRVLYNGEKLPFQNNKFSTIISNCVFEHIENLEQTLNEIARVLKPGGKLICSVMSDKWEEYLFGNRIFGNLYKNWMRKKQHHVHLLSKDKWIAKFEKSGFECLNQQGYMSKKASQWMDILHYLSIDSLFSYFLFRKWVIFPQRYEFFPIQDWLIEIINIEVDTKHSAGLFFVLKKS